MERKENDNTNTNTNTMMNKKRNRDSITAITDQISVNIKVSILEKDKTKQIDCPYLGTIKRHLLDFDFEKVCSTSLSNLNVYACLICGKYYQGKGVNTYAYTHSLEQDHHLFINLQDQRIICLPDGYEVNGSSLSDIKFNCKPTFTKSDIEKLDSNENVSKALDGTEFIPGSIGFNNIKRTDYVNVIIQALCRVKDLRNFFLKYDDTTADLKFDLNGLFIQKWAELFRKIWNPKNFKGHVSPHEVMQSITLASKNRFKIVEQSDSINFLSWFLNTVHDYLSKRNKSRKTIISESFQGQLLIETFTILKDSDKVGVNDTLVEEDGVRYKYDAKEQNFFFLTLDLPNTPLFKDSSEIINIPQISIFQLLSKYDGDTFTEDPVKGLRRRYHILKQPKNLILYFKRFEKNMFFMEKNNTIVTFPIKKLSLKQYVRDKLMRNDLNYDFVANIIHDGKPDAGSFRVQVKDKTTDKWFGIQDLNINNIMAQSVVVSESYIHVYEGHKNE